MRTLALVLTSLVAVGCAFHHGPPTPEPARGPARDSLLDLDASRGDSLRAHGPVDGVLALLTPRVVYLRAGVPAVYSRDAVRTLLASGPMAIPAGTAWQPLGGAVSYDLRSAYTFGVVGRVNAKPEGGSPAVRFERYIAFWQRESRGPWRIAAYAEVNGSTGREESLPADATTPPHPALNRQMAEAAADVRAADSSFADLSDRMGVAYAFSNTVAPLGVVFGENRLAIGPDAVREVFEARPAGTSLTWRPVYASVAGSLDLGFTIGESIVTGRGASGAAVQRFGKYLTIWAKEKSGWRFVVDGGNTTK